jgi:D-xylono/L-arabinono-1,4-lactonase
MNNLENIGLPEIICDQRFGVAENPLWHDRHQCLYWTDIPAGRVYRCNPKSCAVEQVYEGPVVGGFTIQADDSLLLFLAGGAIAQWNEGRLITVIDGLAAERESRFNDVIADPKGRVFCGTMPTNDLPGRLYILETNGRISKLLDGVQCSNGMAFSGDLKYLLHTDSYARTIHRFHYSESEGTIGARQVFCKVAEGDGYPDGLIRDASGDFWSARWGGGCIVRYSTTGSEIGRVNLPAKHVTSMAFGGSGLTELFVTTASQADPAELSAESGAIFRMSTSIQGMPEFRSRVRV